ncbi:hypothetical protein [Methanobrevibacter sp.]|uniref:hypothetical protein n=1 Tax=Methanobrevibacter sp. TaxID=66852 RepID=UPI00388EBDD2
MNRLSNFIGNLKKPGELDLIKGFKLECEANDLGNMKYIVDKFVDFYPDSYYASSSMVIYIIKLYKENPLKVSPNMLNNLSIMEKNIRFFDNSNSEPLDAEETEIRQWYKREFDENVKFMESEGYRFSSDVE